MAIFSGVMTGAVMGSFFPERLFPVIYRNRIQKFSFSFAPETVARIMEG